MFLLEESTFIQTNRGHFWRGHTQNPCKFILFDSLVHYEYNVLLVLKDTLKSVLNYEECIARPEGHIEKSSIHEYPIAYTVLHRDILREEGVS